MFPKLVPMLEFSSVEAVKFSMIGSTSKRFSIVIVISCDALLTPSLTTAVNAYEFFVSKSGGTLKLTTPVVLSMLKKFASVPLREYDSVSFSTSVAFISMVVVWFSFKLCVADEFIFGASFTLVTVILTVWVALSTFESFTL